MIELLLPMPPSVNRLYKNVGKRRAKSAVYVNWIIEAGLALNKQRVSPVTGRLKVEYRMSFKQDRGQDLENFVKATSDLLVKHGLIEDDKYIDHMTLVREPLGGNSVFITVEEI